MFGAQRALSTIFSYLIFYSVNFNAFPYKTHFKTFHLGNRVSAFIEGSSKCIKSG